jgi:hypothetical protein
LRCPLRTTLVVAMVVTMIVAMVVSMIVTMVITVIVTMVRTLIVVSGIFAVGDLSPGNRHRANRNAGQNSDSKEFFHLKPKFFKLPN